MTTEIWVTFVVAGVAIIAGVMLANHLLDQRRLRRLEELASITLYLRQTWAQLEGIPPQYLPAGLRAVLARAMSSRLARGLAIAPHHEGLDAEADRIALFASAPDSVVVPVNPVRRRDIRRQLLALKRVCTEAAGRGHVSFAEAADVDAIVNALAHRILVDHLVDAAAGAAAEKHFDESLALYERAIAELAYLPVPDPAPEQQHVRDQMAAVEETMRAHRAQQEREADEALERNWAPPRGLHPPSPFLDAHAD